MAANDSVNKLDSATNTRAALPLPKSPCNIADVEGIGSPFTAFGSHLFVSVGGHT